MSIPSNSAYSPVAWGDPPILVSGSGERVGTTTGFLTEAGWRAVTVPFAELVGRAALQGRSAAIWIESGGREDERYDETVRQLAIEARFPLILSGPADMIDRMAAAAGDSAIELLVDPSPADRVAALANVIALAESPAILHDISAEPSATRLRQLSDEVGRIAATLARLSQGPSTAAVELPAAIHDGSEIAAISGEQIREIIRARRLRGRFFDPELFADPAWDMLLDLLQAEIMQHRVPVSSLCIAAAVPPTTALRWIKTMSDAGLFVRRADPNDGRRIFVELSPVASDAMRRYFDAAGAVGAA